MTGVAVCIERSLIIPILIVDNVDLARVIRWGKEEGTVRTEPRERVRSVDAMVGKARKPGGASFCPALVRDSQYVISILPPLL